MIRPINVDDKPDLAKIAEEINRSSDHAILCKGGKDLAVILSTEAYRRLSQEWEKDFAVFDRINEAMKDADPKILEQDIARAIQEVKALKHRRTSDA